MIAELADDDLGDQPRAGNAPSNRSRRRRRARHAVLAVAAGVLGADVFVDFQLGRLVLKDLRDVLANAVLCSAAAATRLLRLRQVQLVPMVRQTRQIELAVAATPTVGCDFLPWFLF